VLAGSRRVDPHHTSRQAVPLDELAESCHPVRTAVLVGVEDDKTCLAESQPGHRVREHVPELTDSGFVGRCPRLPARNAGCLSKRFVTRFKLTRTENTGRPAAARERAA
jgi:hypothetical protein